MARPRLPNEHRDLSVHRVDHFRKDVERPGGAIECSSAVIRDDDRLRTVLERAQYFYYRYNIKGIRLWVTIFEAPAHPAPPEFVPHRIALLGELLPYGTFRTMLGKVALHPEHGSLEPRPRNVALPADAKLVYYKDGRTASVSLVDFPDGRSIRTNGKSDGGINLNGAPLSDETTMTLTAVLPLAINPGARRVAVIGMGPAYVVVALMYVAAFLLSLGVARTPRPAGTRRAGPRP